MGMRGFVSMRGMFDEESADSALKRIDAWERSAAKRAEQAQDLALRTSEMSATVRSRDGLVEVSIGAEGQLTNVNLDERTRQQPAATTARTIMETLEAARAKLIRQFDAATAETLGADSETGRMLVESLRRRLGPPTEAPGEL
jgi:DNA-binding protein YbaB